MFYVRSLAYFALGVIQTKSDSENQACALRLAKTVWSKKKPDSFAVYLIIGSSLRLGTISVVNSQRFMNLTVNHTRKLEFVGDWGIQPPM